jgi:hypothetical protein
LLNQGTCHSQSSANNTSHGRGTSFRGRGGRNSNSRVVGKFGGRGHGESTTSQGIGSLCVNFVEELTIQCSSAISDLIQHTRGRRRVQTPQIHTVLIPIGMRIQVQQTMLLEN